jgi:hypothetical protein
LQHIFISVVDVASTQDIYCYHLQVGDGIEDDFSMSIENAFHCPPDGDCLGVARQAVEVGAMPAGKCFEVMESPGSLECFSIQWQRCWCREDAGTATGRLLSQSSTLQLSDGLTVVSQLDG